MIPIDAIVDYRDGLTDAGVSGEPGVVRSDLWSAYGECRVYRGVLADRRYLGERGQSRKFGGSDFRRKKRDRFEAADRRMLQQGPEFVEHTLLSQRDLASLPGRIPRVKQALGCERHAHTDDDPDETLLCCAVAQSGQRFDARGIGTISRRQPAGVADDAPIGAEVDRRCREAGNENQSKEGSSQLQRCLQSRTTSTC